MALTAGIFGTVFSVTERDRSGILDREDTIGRDGGMAFFTISGYAESRIAVMTRAARFPLLHLRHRIADTSGPSNKNGTVTFIAFKHLEVVVMAESCVESLETNFHDVFMAFLTIALNGKG